MKKIFILFVFLCLMLSKVCAQTPPPKKISMDFENMPVKKALEFLAKFQMLNIIVSPKIEGAVDLHLHDVFCKDAMTLLLRSQNLSQRIEKNVIYIAPAKEMETESQEENSQNFFILHLKFAKAKDIANTIKAQKGTLLSKTGGIIVDERTNSIAIKDNLQTIKLLKSFIQTIDVAIPQVAIEARIVNIDDDYEKNLGFDFNFSSKHFSFNSSGKSSVGNSSFQYDLPNTGKSETGLALYPAVNTTLINLQLEALATQGHAEIISDPKLITANRQTATIQSGEEIPYQSVVSNTGATKTAFKKAVLSLKVTPQITLNHQILLALKLNQDKRSSTEVKGVPTISTRQIETQVLVNSGETIVLGGIYEKTKIHGVSRIPFLSDLPGIGVLFQKNRSINTRRELLIFVTPRIIYDRETHHFSRPSWSRQINPGAKSRQKTSM